MAADTSGPSTIPSTGADEGLEKLELLDKMDHVLVKQQLELLEIALDIEMQNKYVIQNINEEIVYFAMEDTGLVRRNILGPYRAFRLPIFNENRAEILVLSRPVRCNNICGFCCLQLLTVALPSGTVLGYVKQNAHILPRYDVQNASGDVILRIKGPLLTCSLFGEVIFQVVNLNQEEVAVISKQWGGAREFVTDADYFSIAFGEPFDIKTKAILLGALFLIDYVYFEN